MPLFYPKKVKIYVTFFWLLSLSKYCLAMMPSEWNVINETGRQHSKQVEPSPVYQLYQLSEQLVKHTLAQEGEIIIHLPIGNGEFSEYLITPARVMERGLAEKYPAIRSFSGVNRGNSNEVGRFTLTAAGFDAMFEHQGHTYFIDPVKGYAARYAVYNQLDAIHPLPDVYDEILYVQDSLPSLPLPASFVDVSGLRELRIAFSTNSTYSAIFNSNKAAVVGELTRLVNRLNFVYERELGIRFVLINDTDKTIFINPATDPFINRNNDLRDAAGELVSAGDITINMQVQAEVLGKENFDIGHLLNTSRSGLAYLGSVCLDDPWDLGGTFKSGGVSGADPYGAMTGDAFFITLVAHELGHQLGAEHSFNGGAGNCQNRSMNTATWEPGGGSSIMGYVGICDDLNLQSQPDPHFHAGSLQQMQGQLRAHRGTCGRVIGQTNQPPVVSAGEHFTIPPRTPFKLMAQAYDPDDDEILYRWAQLDAGTQASFTAADLSEDSGLRPLFRTYPATKSNVRYFPSLEGVLSGKLAIGEAWPTKSRVLTFNVTALDNHGGVAMDQMSLTIAGNNPAFLALTPSLTWHRGETVTVKWQVANTDQPPFNCTSVNIDLAVNGNNFDQRLASEVLNNGAAAITVPDVETMDAKLMVSCSNSVFYAVTPDIFSIAFEPFEPPIVMKQAAAITVVEGEPYQINVNDFIFVNPHEAAHFTIAAQPGEGYVAVDDTVIASVGTSGTLPVQVLVKHADLVSEPFILMLSVQPKASITDNNSAGGAFSWWFGLLLLSLSMLKRGMIKYAA